MSEHPLAVEPPREPRTLECADAGVVRLDPSRRAGRELLARAGRAWRRARRRREESRVVQQWLATHPPSLGRSTGAKC